jgi:acetyl esterase/lipase
VSRAIHCLQAGQGGRLPMNRWAIAEATMTRVAWVLVLLLGAGVAQGADDTKKTSYEVDVVKDVAYRDTDADKVRHKLDLYLPKGAKNYPVLFFIHGGGWRGGSKNGFARHGKLCASHGIAFVAINYRLSNKDNPEVKHPDHIKDVAQAFAFAHKDLAKRGANVEQIYVSGHSAGGHLCALLATDASYLKEYKLSPANIRGVIPISGVFNINNERMKGLFGDEDSRKKASPLTHVRKELPPFLIFYADKEIAMLGKQAEQFSKAMKDAGAKAEAKMIKDRDHGSIMGKAAAADDEVAKAIFAFIKDNGGFKSKE